MPDPTTRLKDGELLAAIDLGSNSFHMVVARYMLGQLRIVDRLREVVRLADGLDGHGGLRQDALQRALDCLSRFGQRVRTLPHHRVRAVATNTVRALRVPQAFLLPAETALGHPIEVVAGREEARLIYLGVANGQPSPLRRLVMDIGGGSTEFIIGEGYRTLERESLQMGCVATTRRFFGDGKLGRKRWREALTEISAEFQQFAATYRRLGWDHAIGSSGTIKAIGDLAAGLKLPKGQITSAAVGAVRDALLEFDRIDGVRMAGLSADRRPVIVGGVLILEAAFNELGLDQLRVSKTAMREGILHDMIGRASDADPRDASVHALSQRYAIDPEQAQRVEHSALALFEQVAVAWGLGEEDRRMTAWAARIHEIGLAIAHSQYHAHGAYIIENSDIAGFSKQEQQVLAALVRCQRRAIAMPAIDAVPERHRQPTLRCVVLLRLAVLLHRSHDPGELPPIRLEAEEQAITLGLSGRWIDSHPLTRADLDTEREYLREIGFALDVIEG